MPSLYVSRLSSDQRRSLEEKLHDIQLGNCFICEEPIDLQLHAGQLELDHIKPLALHGSDTENNLALTHRSCNRNKGASDLRVARCLAKLKSLERAAMERGDRGANLGDVLGQYRGSKAVLPISYDDNTVQYSFAYTGDNQIISSPLYEDKLSKLRYFNCVAPLEYIHHDDSINPRSIGSNIRGLIEEFLDGRPQLHVGLAWWSEEGSGSKLKLFDGQHKAAAQIFLDVDKLPIRVFVEPDIQVLKEANTNAGSKLRQVAFDKAVMRYLGSTLYRDRLEQYQREKGLGEDDYGFSEADLVKHFSGQKSQMASYIVDVQRDAIARNTDNRLLEFVEWSGKGTGRPIAYSTVESAFFQLLCRKVLTSPIDQGSERELERRQMTTLMSLFADIFYIGQWDPDVGGYQIENRIRKGEHIPDGHLRAWRVSREEVAINILRWVRLVIQNHNAVAGKQVENDYLMLQEFPDALWGNIERFLRNLSYLPCWINTDLSESVFGAKRNVDYWYSVFNTGKSTDNSSVLPSGLVLQEMIADS